MERNPPTIRERSEGPARLVVHAELRPGYEASWWTVTVRNGDRFTTVTGRYLGLTTWRARYRLRRYGRQHDEIGTIDTNPAEA